MKATTNGVLNEIKDCYISIPNAGTIIMRSLPDISDSKQASYNNEPIMGRSFPMYTYSHSGDRTIGFQLHFFIIKKGDGTKNINYLRMLQSALYPRPGMGGAPYLPPVVCSIKCGQLIGEGGVCALLQSCSVKFPTEVAWDMETFCPYRFDVDTNWLVAYPSSDLPFQERIVKSGR